MREVITVGPAGIERFRGWRRIHRVGVEPRVGVERAGEADAVGDGPVRREDQAVELGVERAGQRPPRLVRRAPQPAVAAVLGHDVHHAGDRLAVAGGESVGDERRLGEHVGRHADADAAGRGIDLILHA